VTAIRPEDLDFPSTMTDINHDTWMLSGSAVMQNGITLRNGYGCDLDTLTTGTRIGKGLRPDVCDNRWYDLLVVQYRKHHCGFTLA